MSWSKKWPNKRGYYWFFGWCFSSRTRLPELHFVKVRLDGTKRPLYITNGHFLYKAEGAEGVWLPVELPEPPATNGSGAEG